jgi:hypothetical protein
MSWKKSQKKATSDLRFRWRLFGDPLLSHSLSFWRNLPGGPKIKIEKTKKGKTQVRRRW